MRGRRKSRHERDLISDTIRHQLEKGQWCYTFNNSGLIFWRCNFDPYRPNQPSFKSTPWATDRVPIGTFVPIDRFAVRSIELCCDCGIT